ncbi:hypothetical protein GCM10018954_072760 [Kutzneria kofuensis]
MTVGLGLGMASVFGYGYQLHRRHERLADHRGAGDRLGGSGDHPAHADGRERPGQADSVALAAALTGTTGAARAGGRVVWLAGPAPSVAIPCLSAGARFGATMGVLKGRLQALPAEQSAALGEVIQAGERPDGDAGGGRQGEVHSGRSAAGGTQAPKVALPRDAPERLVDDLWRLIDTVHDAVTTRDRSTSNFPRHFVRQALRRELEGALLVAFGAATARDPLRPRR